MNWGNRIVLVFICFATFIGYMVVRAFQENIDLVAEDYYAKEIAYQNKLQKLSNASLDNKEIIIRQTSESVVITFPEQAEGQIHFYHPSRKIFDRTFDIALNENFNQEISKSDLISGSYRVNVSWEVDNKDYLQQSSIYIQ